MRFLFQTLQDCFTLLCLQRPLPLQSLHKRFTILFAQIPFPLQTLEFFLIIPWVHHAPPPQDLQ